MGCIMSFLHSSRKQLSFHDKILKKTAEAEQDIAKTRIRIKTRINDQLDNLIKKRFNQLYETLYNNVSKSSGVAARSAMIYIFKKEYKNINLNLSEDNIEKEINKLTLDDLCSLSMKKNIVIKYNGGLIFNNEDIIMLPTIDSVIDKLQKNDDFQNFNFTKGKTVEDDSSFLPCIITTW